MKPLQCLLVILLGTITNFLSCSLLTPSDKVNGFAASQGEGSSIKLSWSNPVDEKNQPLSISHYVLARSPSFISGSLTINDTTYTDTSIDYVTPVVYTYTIYGVLTAGGSTSTSTVSGYGLISEKLYWYTSFKSVPIPSASWLRTMVSPGLKYQFRLANMGLQIFDEPGFNPSSPSWTASDPGASPTDFDYQTDTTKFIRIKVLPAAGAAMQARYW